MTLRERLSDLSQWWSLRPPWMFNRPSWQRIAGRPLPPGQSEAAEHALRNSVPQLADNVSRNSALLERLRRKRRVTPAHIASPVVSDPVQWPEAICEMCGCAWNDGHGHGRGKCS